MSEFLPLRKKLRRAETGKEDNFVPPYLPESLAAAGSSGQDFDKVIYAHYNTHNVANNYGCGI